jgi:hypothetical protein
MCSIDAGEIAIKAKMELAMIITVTIIAVIAKPKGVRSKGEGGSSLGRTKLR